MKSVRSALAFAFAFVSSAFTIFTILLIGIFALPLRASEKEISPVSNTQLLPHMQISYKALIKVLSEAAKDQEAVTKADRATTETNLKVIVDQAKTIHSLVSKSDKEHVFLSEELLKTSSLAYSRYQKGFRDQARFYIGDIVNTCFGCHTSRSSTADSHFTTAFNKDIQKADFDPLAKARFLSLSRQFDASAKAYESLLLSQKLSTDEMINLDPMVEYLILTLRVKADSARALKTLKSMQVQSFPEVVKRDINSWVASLNSLPNADAKSTGLERARQLIGQAKIDMEYPKDRSGMVQYILASKHLHEYLKEADLTNQLKAEAYYELGGCELILVTQFSGDEANNYFSEVIRLSPKTELSRKAYARYEENVLYGYSGSSGVNLPDDERIKLKDLKKLAL